MADNNEWVDALGGLRTMADMWPTVDQDDASGALADLYEAIEDGKVGRDLAMTIRSSFRDLSRVGWNEDEISAPNILDGIEAALDHYHGGAIYLEELAIGEMMEAADNGDTQRAKHIQKALWEWELSLNEFVPAAATVFEPMNEKQMRLEDSIADAYDDPELALQANVTSVGYQDEDKHEREQNDRLAQEQLAKRGYYPTYVRPDYNSEQVERGMDEMHTMVLRHLVNGEPLWKLVYRIFGITAKMGATEKALVVRRSANFIRNKLDEGTEAYFKRMMVGYLFDEQDLDDDNVWFYLFEDYYGEEPDYEIQSSEVDELYKLIALPPEHPQWHPIHDIHYLRGSRLLTSREPVKDCINSGWAAYKMPRLARYRKQAARRHRTGQLEMSKVVETGVSDGRRTFTWDKIVQFNGQLRKLVVCPKEQKTQLLVDLAGIQHEGARLVEGVLQ